MSKYVKTDEGRFNTSSQNVYIKTTSDKTENYAVIKDSKGVKWTDETKSDDPGFSAILDLENNIATVDWEQLKTKLPGAENGNNNKEINKIVSKGIVIVNLYELINQIGNKEKSNPLELKTLSVKKIEKGEPVQKIIFGPPGTGKSQKVKNMYFKDRIITAFHPEYTYGDFIAKLMPISIEGKVEYQVVPGHFIKALAKALLYPNERVLLQIEEINRGNCAAIFGDIFHLLDRDKTGISEYRVSLSELATKALKQELGYKEEVKIAQFENEGGAYIPANLSIIATMNTSDESVYFMDSAFKRRWQFEYLDVDSNILDEQAQATVYYKANGVDNNTSVPLEWNQLRQSINNFMKHNSKRIRGIEDKQIGLWFLKANGNIIREDDIKYKLMHYLWDNVFSRDKTPLIDLIQSDEGQKANQDRGNRLVTFGDFLEKKDSFIKTVVRKYVPKMSG